MASTNSGRFVWYELMTSDVTGAIEFYTDVVGWKTQPWDESYMMWCGPAGPLGGVRPMTEDAKQASTPPHWTASVHVDDVERSVALVRELGGRCLVEPTDLPKIGRFAVIADPQGASLDIIQPLSPMKVDDTPRVGEFSWRELMTTDHRAAIRFYSKLFGWDTAFEHDMGEMGKYLIFANGAVQLGGMFTIPKGTPMPTSWLCYVRVADLDASLARAKQRRAHVLNGPMDVPGGGRIVQLLDAEGAAFALHETSASQA